MSKFMIAFLMAGAVLMTACVPSLNPFYSEKTLTSDDALVGAWGDKGATKPHWTIKKLEKEMGYQVITEGEKGTLALHLFKLGDQSFFDFSASEAAPMTLPVHTLARAWIEKDRVRISFMSPEKVEKFLKAKPELLAHTRTEYEKGKDGLLLTATTPRLQAFVKKNQAKIFADAAEFFRIGQAAKPAAK